MLLKKLKDEGINFFVNPRKRAIQINVSLWQAHAANGLCKQGYYGQYARKHLGLEDHAANDNPFEDDMSNEKDEVLRQFPAVKKQVMDALKWGDLDKWKKALKASKDFRTQLKPKLDRGEKPAQAVNRDKVIALGMLLQNQMN